MGSKKASIGDGASPGKIFIGGLAKDTTMSTFTKYFGKYGEITDSVIMKDRYSGQPRGFGFVTYADPAVVDKVIEETHVINGKQVEIKRTIPKGAILSKDFKTKKIFVGGIPTTVTDDEFKEFFEKYGEVTDHEIIRDHATNRSRGFGFIVFDSEDVVDDILTKGNRIDFAGSQVEIKKAEPKKPSNPSGPAYSSDIRARPFNDGMRGFGDSYGSFGPSYREPGLGSRLGGYGGYGGGGDFGGEFSSYGGGIGGYRGDSSLGYSSRLGSYGGGFGGVFSREGLGGYGPGTERYGGYGSSSYGSSYDTAPPGGGYSGLYGSRGGYSGGGAGRYHPYR